MKFEELLPQIKIGTKYKRKHWKNWYTIDMHDAFEKMDILADDWEVQCEPEVIEIEDLPILTNAYSDPMYGFVAYCDKDFVQKLSGKRWKAVFTEVIE